MNTLYWTLATTVLVLGAMIATDDALAPSGGLRRFWLQNLTHVNLKFLQLAIMEPILE